VGATVQLPALLASPHCTVSAIGNSSVEFTKASINVKSWSNIETYGSVDDLAQRPGKNVVLERPLGANTTENEEWVDLA
jgi:hypothetical protein